MKSLVLFSGGLDSTVCLFWAKKTFGENTTALYFSYNQQNQMKEEEAVKKITEMAQISFKKLTIDKSLIVVPENFTGDFFIPGRNLLFLALSGIFAFNHKIDHIVLGTRSLARFPDCWDDFTKSAQVTLNLTLATNITIHTPLMNLTKGQTIKLAEEIGCFTSLAHSHTCYGSQELSCNNCEACAGRILAFQEIGKSDPMLERINHE